MKKIIDLTGLKFNKLQVLNLIDIIKEKSYWLCKCDCGNYKSVRSDSLKNGSIKSCGCLRIEKATRHGMRYSPVYHVWQCMVQRCTNKNEKYYKDYGGRGIKVCDKWLKFENFLEDMGLPPTNKHQIDRIDNNKGYYKENCHWVLSKENMRNRRNTIFITVNNIKKTLGECSEQYDIPYRILYSRIIEAGWQPDIAVRTPVKKYREKL